MEDDGIEIAEQIGCHEENHMKHQQLPINLAQFAYSNAGSRIL